jgi:hypothetical protein
MQYKVNDLGFEQDPKKVNLGHVCSPSEQATLKLFRQYKNVFAWTYDDLKTYDTRII